MSNYNNFWNVASLPYGRSSGELIVELNRKNPSPPPTPYELLGAVSDQVWEERIKKLLAHLHRYCWSLGERIYLAIGIALSIIMPWPIMFLLNRAIAGNIDTDNTQTFNGRPFLSSNDAVQLHKARLASFGVLVGLYFIVWVPYGIFKYLGGRRRRTLLQSFSSQDSSPQRNPETHLLWHMRSASAFHGRAQLVVKLPVGLKSGGVPNMSNFAPGANLPVYVAYPQAWENVNLADEKAGLYAPPNVPPPAQQQQRPTYAPPPGPPPMAGNEDRV